MTIHRLAMIVWIAHVLAQPCEPGFGGPDCSVSRRSIALLRHHDPYDGLKLRPPRLTGWSKVADSAYFKLISLANATVAVEVGVWRGLSASLLAKSMRDCGKGGVLFAVDTWLGAIEFWNLRFSHGKPDPARDMELINGYPSVFYTFLSNMVHENVSKFVVPLPMTSAMGASLLARARVKIDLIHLDAAHEYGDIKQDIELWLPLLARCGVLLGDDYIKNWPGVKRAVNELAHEKPWLRVFTSGYGVKWYARRRECEMTPPANISSSPPSPSSRLSPGIVEPFKPPTSLPQVYRNRKRNRNPNPKVEGVQLD